MHTRPTVHTQLAARCSDTPSARAGPPAVLRSHGAPTGERCMSAPPASAKWQLLRTFTTSACSSWSADTRVMPSSFSVRTAVLRAPHHRGEPSQTLTGEWRLLTPGDMHASPLPLTSLRVRRRMQLFRYRPDGRLRWRSGYLRHGVPNGCDPLDQDGVQRSRPSCKTNPHPPSAASGACSYTSETSRLLAHPIGRGPSGGLSASCQAEHGGRCERGKARERVYPCASSG